LLIVDSLGFLDVLLFTMVPIVSKRDYKNFIQGGLYHVFNRGNAKMPIFLSPDDYEFFLLRLKQNLYPSRFEIKKNSVNGYTLKALPEGSFDLICFCLMPNHFHFILKQNSKLPISNLISKVCCSYSKYFNKKYERVGSLFQDQFKSVKIESNEQLLWLISYIHSNPVRAKLVDKPEDYLYSSISISTMVPIVDIVEIC